MTLGVITVNTVLRALVFQAETLKYMYDICGLIKKRYKWERGAGS